MFLLLGGRVIQVLLSVALIRLATTFLSPSEYGTWILIQTTAGLFILFGISPFGLYLNRHIIDFKTRGLLPEAFKGYSAYLVLFSLAMIAVNFGLLGLGIIKFPDLSMMAVTSLVCLLMVSQTFHQTWIPSLNFLGDRKGFVLGSSTALLLTILLAFSLNAVSAMSVSWWVISVSFGFIVSTLMFVPKSWFHPTGRGLLYIFKSVQLRDVFLFSGPLFLTTAFSWGQTQGYRLLVENRLGLAEFGIFAAGYAVIAGLLGSVENVITTFYQAEFFQNINGEGSVYQEELKKVWSVAMYPYVMAGVYLYLVAPQVALIFLGGEFKEDLSWLSFVVLAEGGRLFFNLLSINFYGKKETHKLVLPQVLSVALSLSIMVFLNSLNSRNVIFALSAGYGLASIILLMTDFKTFVYSSFLKSLAMVIMAGGVFLLLGKLAGLYLSDQVLFSIITVAAALFMFPYFRGHLRKRNG